MTRSSDYRKTLIASGALYILMAMIMVFWGRHHVDEGYYHLIARMTAGGALPYRDYFYVQTPLYPFVYAAFMRIFGYSLILARCCSLVLGLAAFLLSVRTARNLAGPPAALAAAALILVQPFTIYYLTIVKLYALTSLLLTGLVYVLTTHLAPAKRYGIAAGLAALAIGTRLTVLPALPIVWLAAAMRTQGKERLRVVFAAFLSGLIVLALVLIPFQWISWKTFLYSIVGYHFDKEGFSLIRQFSHRLDVLFRLSRLYVLTGLFILTSFIVRWFGWSGDTKDRPDIPGWPKGAVDAAWVLAGIAAFHFTSQAPYTHRYLAMLLPPVAAVLGPEIIRLFAMTEKTHFQTPCLMGVVAVCFLFVGMGQPEVDLSNPSPVAQLRQIASEIAMVTNPDDEILTFNNSIAVEADRRVLPGDEMNVLTYHPAWDRSRCLTYHVLNVDMLEEALVTCRIRAVLITRYSFIGNFPTFYNPGETGARPRILYALEKHYRRVRTFKGFGYMGEDAELYLPLNTRSESDIKEFENSPSVHIYRNEGDQSR